MLLPWKRGRANRRVDGLGSAIAFSPRVSSLRQTHRFFMTMTIPARSVLCQLCRKMAAGRCGHRHSLCAYTSKTVMERLRMSTKSNNGSYSYSARGGPTLVASYHMLCI